MTDRAVISTTEEFNAALVDLLAAGVDAGVDVNGGWTCRNNSGQDDYEVVVTELADPNSGS